MFRIAIAAWLGLVAASAAAEDVEDELYCLVASLRTARSLNEQAVYIPQLVALGEQSFVADEYAVAVKAYDYAQRIARRIRPVDAAGYARRMSELRTVARAYAAVRPYIGKADDTARRRLAEFTAFVKGDWPAAVSDLALGDDAIAKAAQLDMQRLSETAEAAADAWVEAAKLSKKYAAAMQLRAGTLYHEAAAATPTTALLKKMAALGTRIGYATAPPKSAVRVRGGKYAFSPGRIVEPWKTPDKAFDGDFTTPCHAHKDSTAWLGVDLRTPRAVTRISYAPSDARTRASIEWFEKNRTRMVGATIQVSNHPDFRDAVTVFTIMKPPPQLQLTTVKISPSGVWRYVRYVPKPGDDLAIGEFDVR